VQPARLWVVVRELQETWSDGLRVCLALSLATSPALLLPQMPAQLLCHVRTSLYKLQAPLEVMNSALWQLQVKSFGCTCTYKVLAHTCSLNKRCFRALRELCHRMQGLVWTKAAGSGPTSGMQYTWHVLSCSALSQVWFRISCCATTVYNACRGTGALSLFNMVHKEHLSWCTSIASSASQ
jgi:hypothetical protein